MFVGEILTMYGACFIKSGGETGEQQTELVELQV